MLAVLHLNVAVMISQRRPVVEVSSGGFGIGGRRAEGLDSASRASDAKEVCTNMTVDGAALGGFCSKNLIPAVALRHITKILLKQINALNLTTGDKLYTRLYDRKEQNIRYSHIQHATIPQAAAGLFVTNKKNHVN